MIKPLTSLRFFFALMIFLMHSFYEVSEETFIGNQASIEKMFNSFFKYGHVGVTFFFVLSGFILAYNYQDRLLEKKVSIFDFYVYRIARIYPLHLFLLGTVVLTNFGGVFGDFSIKKGLIFISKLTLTQSFIPSHKFYFSYAGITWSISCEMFFYFMLPFLVWLFFYKIKRKKIRYTFLFITCLYVIIVGELLQGVWKFNFLYANPLIRVVDFLIGIFLFNIYRELKVNKDLNRYNFTILEIVSVGLFFVFVYFQDSIPSQYHYAIFYWIPISFIILIFSFQKGFLSKILSHSILIFLGEISFSFYMLHYSVIGMVIPLSKKMGITNGYLIILIIFFIAIFVSYLGYKLIEMPCNRYLRKAAKKENKFIDAIRYKLDFYWNKILLK
ncbi:MAG: acyltransferase family protein [Flavobacteriales bacterium]